MADAENECLQPVLEKEEEVRNWRLDENSKGMKGNGEDVRGQWIREERKG